MPVLTVTAEPPAEPEESETSAPEEETLALTFTEPLAPVVRLTLPSPVMVPLLVMLPLAPVVSDTWAPLEETAALVVMDPPVPVVRVTLPVPETAAVVVMFPLVAPAASATVPEVVVTEPVIVMAPLLPAVRAMLPPGPAEAMVQPAHWLMEPEPTPAAVSVMVVRPVVAMFPSVRLPVSTVSARVVEVS